MKSNLPDSEVPLEPSLKRIQTNNFGKINDVQYKVIQEISKCHIDSFNFLLKEGLAKAVQDIPPMEFEVGKGDRITLEIREANIGYPTVHKESIEVTEFKMFPAECRSRGKSYTGRLQLSVSWKLNGIHQNSFERVVGHIPIMVKSNVCNLVNLTPKQLVRKGEEAEEFGGYFIINGNERLLRLLIMQRRNYPLAMTRPSWKKRGKLFSEYGVIMRCVKPDQTGTNIVLHYLTNGTAQLMFSYNKELFFVPIMMVLKAMCNVTDFHIFSEMIKGKEHDTFFKGCIVNMLRQVQSENLHFHQQIKNYIGSMFRVKLGLPAWYPDEEITDFLIKYCICTHLESHVDKFNILVFMTRKLFSVAKGECALESPDNTMNQEVLLGGHLYLAVLKEKILSWMYTVRQALDLKSRKSNNFNPNLATVMQCLTHAMDLGRPMEYMLATGNLISKSGLGMMQYSGLTIVAEKLNFWRYLSHFRCVHRGAFFQQMRTTTVRKLLPEAWGFLCPVHTPDGSPCGLLNHLTADCLVINEQPPIGRLPQLLTTMGMTPLDSPTNNNLQNCYTVQLDGKILGWLLKESAPNLVHQLRCIKATDPGKVPSTLEIAFVPATSKCSQYPGLFLFSTPARFMRPVLNLATKTTELIGSFEQVYLDIAIVPEEAHAGITTHMELRETSFLSILGSQIPYPDFNQSPRNMYECQMGKQTMGNPCHTYRHRSDNKMYRIQNPQSPLVRPVMHDYYHMDDYPFGTNAVVAVISYTGYDMEDAMILNKASLERGFKHGSIYKSHFVNLRMLSNDRGNQITYVFGRKAKDLHLNGKIDMDGLPFIGNKLKHGDPICSYINLGTGEVKVEKYSSSEEAYIMQVKVLGNDTGTDIMQSICVTFWIPRNPIIGDKFASRHGQKGVCSQKWPQENMPFTESGMTPDIVFNPHGFPSRMTIGMMIESMAGKSAALHGLVHDATPFKFSEKQPASEYFGELLQTAGYNYYGTERMYSGVDGRELEADIFFGIVYYQRLRHMVADKFQVRTTGTIDTLTHQPVKGRKRGGGIRFGEMERDSLLAHGTSFLLHDRLFNCSDKSLAYVCKTCGSILSPTFEKPFSEDLPASREISRTWVCTTCNSSDDVVLITVPYVFRYLVAELASINLKVKLNIK